MYKILLEADTLYKHQWERWMRSKLQAAKTFFTPFLSAKYRCKEAHMIFEMVAILSTEYASQVWDPHLQKDIDQLECVQKFALRMCAKQWDLGYAELLNCFKVPSLRDRRNCLSLCTMYKVVHDFPMMCLCLGLPH